MNEVTRILSQPIVDLEALPRKGWPPPLQLGERVRLYNRQGIFTVTRVSPGSASVSGRQWVKPFDVPDKKTGGFKTVPGHWAKVTLPPISRYAFVERVGDDEVDESTQGRSDASPDASGDNASVRVRTNSPYEGKRGRHPQDCYCSTHGKTPPDPVRETQDEVS